MSIFIVEVREDEEIYQYEYSNLKHAREHLNNEVNGTILEYKEGKYHFVECK